MFQGSMVALVTPMHEDGAVDFDCLDRLVDWHIEAGTDAIVAVGTTGEASTLDNDEHCDVIARVVKRAAKRVPVVAGTGSNCTREAIELTRCAKDVGADACLSVTPYYVKPTQNGLYEHFKAIASAVDLPVILYNVPGRTAIDMLPETVQRLAGVPGIVAIKEASGNLDRIKELVQRCGKNFPVLSGDDAITVDAIGLGAKGVISVTANVAPYEMAQMCALALKGDIAKANAINQRLEALHRDLFVEGNPIPVKWALATMGKIKPALRMPLTPLSSGFHPTVRAALQRAELI